MVLVYALMIACISITPTVVQESSPLSYSAHAWFSAPTQPHRILDHWRNRVRVRFPEDPVREMERISLRAAYSPGCPSKKSLKATAFPFSSQEKNAQKRKMVLSSSTIYSHYFGTWRMLSPPPTLTFSSTHTLFAN